MSMKRASIFVEGAGDETSDRIIDIPVNPDDTIEKILGFPEVKLEGYELRNASDVKFAKTDILHQKIENGEELFAFPIMNVA